MGKTVAAGFQRVVHSSRVTGSVLAVLLCWAGPLWASGACGAGGVISSSGFEDLPDYAINFVSDANTVFTASGQSYTFTVEFVDSQGTPLDASGLEWCLADDSLLSISPSGLSATVSSTGFGLGNVAVVVRDPQTSISNRATVAFADLTANAVYLDGAWVEDNGGGVGDVVLTRNASTELIQVDDVLVSGDLGGLLVRVLSVSLTPSQVILGVEEATITDAFQNLDVQGAAQVQSTRVTYDAPTGRVDMVSRVGFGPPRTSSFSLDAVECKTETEVPYPLTLSNARIDWKIDVALDGTLKIAGGSLKEFSLLSTKTVTLKASDSTLSFGASLTEKIICEVPLPSYATPTLPLSVFSFGLAAQPKLGVEASGSISSPSFSISGPSGHLVSQTTDGIKYTDTGGWEPIKAYATQAKGSLYKANTNTEFGFSLGAKAYGGMGFELVASLGKGFFSYELARVEFTDLQADLTLSSALATPLDPMDKDYTGPTWGLAANAMGEFKAELTGGGLDTLLNRLNIGLSIGIGGPIFDPINVPLAGSPTLEGLDFTCSPVSCYLDTEGNDELLLGVTTDGERKGVVRYLVSRDAASTLTELTSGALADSVALDNWTPSMETPDGAYQLYLRVESDPLSTVLPYRLPTTADHAFEIGPTATLTVEKRNQADSSLITGGRVVAAEEGIDCGVTCDYVYASGSMVTLTAENTGGWTFIQWSGDSDACPGSTEPTCPVSLSIDLTARALYEENLEYVLEYGTSTSSLGGFEKIGEIRAGDEVTAYPSQYTVGLTLAGENVQVVNGGFYWPLDVFNAWGFQDYGQDDFPPAGQPALNFEIQVKDFTNRDPETGAPRDVRIPIKLRISNEAYRKLAGANYVLGGTYGGDNLTLEPFADGELVGSMTYVKSSGETIIGTWSMISSASYSTYVRAPCSAFTPGAFNPLIIRAGRASISGVTFPVLDAGGGHAWTSGNERDHYCTDFEVNRIITNDH